MYKKEFDISNDRKGAMTGKAPDPSFVADIITGLYHEGCNLEKLYDLLKTEYVGENDFYALLSDISDVLDTIDLEVISDLGTSYGTGLIYSHADRWIMSALNNLHNNNTFKDDEGNEYHEETILTQIQKIADDCDYISQDEMLVYAHMLYNNIAAMFFEIYNTYGVERFIKARTEELPIINDVTRGFNEFLVRQNLSIDEAADILYAKTQKFVFVSNEVDRDPEISKKIRGMVPTELKEEFESVIELITEEDIENILNGRQRITAKFLASLGSSDDDDEVDME